MAASTDSLRQSPAFLGATVRDGQEADAVDGVTPQTVVEPADAGGVAAILALASRESLHLVVRGGGTKLEWGRRPGPIDLLVSLRRLRRVLAHEHADLTASVEAGATLQELAAALARHRQWLPLDACAADATVGGAIATNDSGPLRHRFGAPRDLLIGVRLATTDGRVVKAGGNVVKNVAGYDLGKLVSGSFGSLAVIVSATFKLLPAPQGSHTLIARFADRTAAAAAVAALGASQIEPSALEVHADAGRDGASYRILVRFATTPASAAAQAGQARALVGTGDVLADETDAAVWRDLQARAFAPTGALVGMTWLPAALPDVLALLEELAPHGDRVELFARAGVGAGLVRLGGDAGWQASVITRLRSRPDLVSHVVIRRAPPAVKQQVDVWGPPGAAGRIGALLKRALDPMDILNAGRGPV